MYSFVEHTISVSLSHKSILVAGIDPTYESIPACFHEKNGPLENQIYRTLSNYLECSLACVAPHSCAVKANSAFFEQFGVAGMRAFADLALHCSLQNIPFIADAKRGDIGSTAAAYANAFSGKAKWGKDEIIAFRSHALTVNPFLGFDTLEPFVKHTQQNGLGLFVLLCTSNPGATDLQSPEARQAICQKLQELSKGLPRCEGFCSLGAVVGATKPEDAATIRKALPEALFLVPGFGAQGGKATDALAGIAPKKKHSGLLVNASRGIFQSAQSAGTVQDFRNLVRDKAKQLQLELIDALAAVTGHS